MSTLSKQSITSAVTESSQEASSLPSQGLPPCDSTTDLGQSLSQSAEAETIAALMAPTLSAAERQQQGLQLLTQNAIIHSGDLSAAAAVITQTAAIALGADRVSLWLHTADVCAKQQSEKCAKSHTEDCSELCIHRGLKQIASYNSIEHNYASGALLSAAQGASYFETWQQRSGFAIENTGDSQSEAIHWIACLKQQNLLFHASGAFFEVPIRYQGNVTGALWYEYAQPHCWSELENMTAVSISLLTTTAIAAQKQQALSRSLANHSRQLKRETIEREQAEQAWQESQRFIQGIIDASTNILYVDNVADNSNVYISRWIENVLGYKIDEVQRLGPHYLEQLVHDDQKEQIAAERQKLAAIKDGEVVENEYQFRHRRGHWRWLLCRETVFQRDEAGQPSQIFGTATDITKRKRAEDSLKEFNEELTRLARMDGLTQVANRRAFDQKLHQEWQKLGTRRSPLSLILCDIDYFKYFNDTYGHQAGDVCLRQVAQAIERAVKRSTDLVARYGGEEFAIILPNTAVAGLMKVASEIQREIQKLAIPHSGSAVSQYITVSLGLAMVNSTKNIHPDLLVAAADQGLYQAKHDGRNRFCLSEVEPEI